MEKMQIRWRKDSPRSMQAAKGRGRKNPLAIKRKKHKNKPEGEQVEREEYKYGISTKNTEVIKNNHRQQGKKSKLRITRKGLVGWRGMSEVGDCSKQHKNPGQRKQS